MQVFLFIILLANSFIGYVGFRFLNRSRLLFSDRFGFIVALTGSSILGIVTSLHLFLLFPTNLGMMSALNMTIGILIGMAFGSILNTQSLIAGFFNGGVAGMMGTMIGAVALNPAICGLPPSAFTEQSTLLVLGLFSFILLSLTFGLLCFALRV